MIGQTISHYRILGKLGEGGMGVVYRAEDLKLGRTVALKFLTGQHDEHRERFLREVRAAAALNHPNVCTVYAVDEEHWFLAMELVDGPTVKQKIEERPLPVDAALDIAVQVVQGLQAAHEKGVVHRDIKPGNLLLTPEGQVKITDFGLAAVVDSIRLTKSETRLGTPAYMSPEQASGTPTDKRTDLWSAGVVLYEMISGRLPFRGENEAAVTRGILNDTHEPLTALRAGLPLELDRVVAKLLAKAPEERYQHAADLLVDLRGLQRRSSEFAAAGSAARRRGWKLPLGVAAALLLMALVVYWQLSRRDYFWTNPLAGARTERLTDYEGDELDAAISPDGRLAGFLSDRDGEFDVWVTQVGSGDPVNITKGRFSSDAALIRYLGFSGDGNHAWFLERVSRRPNKMRPWLAPSLGGTPRVFLESGMNPEWSPDGSQIVYHTADGGDPIYIADRTGNNPRKIFQDRDGVHSHYLTWSPDGKFIYVVKGFPTTDEMDIWRIPVSAGGGLATAERITHHNARVAYLAWLDSRTLIYTATAEDGSGQWLYALDVERRIPHRVSSGVNEQFLSVSASRTAPRRLLTTIANPAVGLWTVPFSDGIQSEAAASRFPAPNARARGARFASGGFFFLSSKGASDGLWRLENGAARELWKGSDGAVVAPPSLSPDGSTICFSYRKKGRAGLYLMAANGTNVRTLTESLDVRGVASWSPDGKWIALAGNEGGGAHVYKISVSGGRPERMLDVISFHPLWSPDGRFIIYSEQVGGGYFQVKAITPDRKPFPIPDSFEVSYHASAPYRFMPHQNALVYGKGRTVFHQNFYSVDLETGQERQLTDLKPGFLVDSFDISPDGKQIIFDRTRNNSDIVLMDLAR